jgi:hypothetical protein
MDEVYLRIEPRLFDILKRVFDGVAARADTPISQDILDDAIRTLKQAKTRAMPGLPHVVHLTRDAFDCICFCFEVGGDDNDEISDDDYETIHALLEHAGFVE